MSATAKMEHSIVGQTIMEMIGPRLSGSVSQNTHHSQIFNDAVTLKSIALIKWSKGISKRNLVRCHALNVVALLWDVVLNPFLPHSYFKPTICLV